MKTLHNSDELKNYIKKGVGVHKSGTYDNFVVLQFSKKIFCKCVSFKDGPFSPIKYIETKRKSAKSDCVINSYIQNNKKNKKNYA